LKHTIIARTHRSRNGRSGWRHVSLLLILLALLVQPGAQSGDAAAAPLAQLSSISGTVTMNGTGVDDAVVVATRSNLARPAPTHATGAYSLTALPADDYTLSVRPISVTTTSPDWVYAVDPLVVSVPPAATQDFTVQAATVTVAGQLLPPADSGATFDAPNRAWVRAENQEGQGNSVQVASDGSFNVKLLPGVVLRPTVRRCVGYGWSLAKLRTPAARRSTAGTTPTARGTIRCRCPPGATASRCISADCRTSGGACPRICCHPRR